MAEAAQEEDLSNLLLIRRTKEYIELEKKYEDLKNKYESNNIRKRKNYFDICEKQKKKIRKDILESMSQANKFSLSIGLKIQEAILVPLKDINKDDKIHLEIQFDCCG